MELHPTELMPTSSVFLGEPVLACPVCGHDYIHPVKVQIVSPGSERGSVTVDWRGVHLDPQHPPLGRGVVLYLEFHCERGHRLEYRLAFSKGQTLPDLTARDSSDGSETIWRD